LSSQVARSAGKHSGTVEQFKRHITEDVLPPLLNKLLVEVK
jgi:hypothetical protein